MLLIGCWKLSKLKMDDGFVVRDPENPPKYHGLSKPGWL